MTSPPSPGAPSAGGRAARLAVLAALALAACPQKLVGPDTDAGSSGDAAIEPPKCTGGPEITCSADPGNPSVAAVGDLVRFHCQMPAARSGDAPVFASGVPSDQAGLVLATDLNSATGDVTLEPHQVKDQRFAGADVTAWVKAHWDGHPEECTTLEFTFSVSGNLWAADEENGRVLVLDSAGAQVGDPLALLGIDAPRLVAAIGAGEVLVGGKSGGDTVLGVYDTAGSRLREVAGSNNIANPLRAAANLGSTVLLSSGTLTTGGVLHVMEGDSAPDWDGTLAGGLAATDTAIYVGLIGGGDYKTVTSAQIPTTTSSMAYKDSSGDACKVEATTALLHLSTGGFVFALRHAHSGLTKPDPAPLGMLAWTDDSRKLRTVLQHDHASLPGALSQDGPYDWLVEIKPGVVVGTRDNKPGLEKIELGKIAADDQPVKAWAAALGSPRLKGLAKLK